MNFILPLIFLFSSLSSAQSGVSASYLKLTAASLPAVCSAGTTMFSSGQLNLCYPANTWSAVGTPAIWGGIGGTLSSQTDLNTALGLKAPLSSPTFTGSVTTPLSSGIVSSASGVLGTTALSGDVTSSGFATTVGKINGTSLASLGTGILKNTTSTGVPSIAVAADFPTLNQNTSGTASNITGTTNSTLTTASALTSVGAIATGTWNATTVAVAHGGTGQTSNIVAPTATAIASWDANKNLSANALIPGFTTTATSAQTITMTIASAMKQYATGVSTITYKLPTTSVVAGAPYYFEDDSTGNATIQSSGANTILTLSSNTAAWCTALVATPTTAANWTCTIEPFPTGSSSGNVWTSTGASSAPTWQAPSGTSPTGSYAQALFNQVYSWTNTNTSYADYTNTAVGTFTVRKSSGITLTAAASNLPGVTWTSAASTAVYLVIATISVNFQGSGNQAHGLELTDGTTVLVSGEIAIAGGSQTVSTLTGVYVPGNTSANTIKIESYVSAGTSAIGSNNVTSSTIEWTVVRLL